MKPLVSVVATGCKLWPINPRVPTGNRPGLQHLLPENLFFPKCLGGDDVISQNEQYRCYGEQALASAKQATCEEEKAELLRIAETWFELAAEHSDRRNRGRTDSCN